MKNKYSTPLYKLTSPHEDHALGLSYALLAYVFCGFIPLYMKLMDHIPLLEVMAHRILWSLPIAFAIVAITGFLDELKAILKNPRILVISMLNAAIIVCNWGMYIWGITVGETLSTAFGYFINPLFSISLGAILLKEKLTRLQILAVLLAVIAVIIVTIDIGRPPWLALGIAISWSFYGLSRKILLINPKQGFFLELVVLTFPAIAIITWFEIMGMSHFLLTGKYNDTLLLIGFGFITAILLNLFANGAKLLRLSTIGIIQYVSPTISFLISILIFKEPINTTNMVAFSMIWVAIIIYTASIFFGKKLG